MLHHSSLVLMLVVLVVGLCQPPEDLPHLTFTGRWTSESVKVDLRSDIPVVPSEGGQPVDVVPVSILAVD